MAARIWSKVAALVAVTVAQGAPAQDQQPGLTPAGKAILQNRLAFDGQPLRDRYGSTNREIFPLAMCTFPRGLCGAVRRDGTVNPLGRPNLPFECKVEP
jgi:hypothetical protein